MLFLYTGKRGSGSCSERSRANAFLFQGMSHAGSILWEWETPMLGKLEPAQIDETLCTASIGRIGCHADGKTYIIPMNYVYDGENIYGCSVTGMKLEMMRVNPEVCFQVDQVKNLSNWRSVVAWGTFQELMGEEAAKALKLLTRRFTMLIASGQSLHEMNVADVLDGKGLAQKKIMVYRIRLREKTGRFEMTE